MNNEDMYRNFTTYTSNFNSNVRRILNIYSSINEIFNNAFQTSNVQTNSNNNNSRIPQYQNTNRETISTLIRNNGLNRNSLSLSQQADILSLSGMGRQRSSQQLPSLPRIPPPPLSRTQSPPLSRTQSPSLPRTQPPPLSRTQPPPLSRTQSPPLPRRRPLHPRRPMFSPPQQVVNYLPTGRPRRPLPPQQSIQPPPPPPPRPQHVINRNNYRRRHRRSNILSRNPLFNHTTQSNSNSPNPFASLMTNINQISSNLFDPILIIPTEQQIQNATEIISYNITLRQDTCPIDLLLFNTNEDIMRILFCGHIFRPANLQTWFQSSSICPLCRYDIREYNTTDLSNNEPNDNDSNDNESTNDNGSSNDNEPEPDNNGSNDNEPEPDNNGSNDNEPDDNEPDDNEPDDNEPDITETTINDTISGIELHNNVLNTLQTQLQNIITETLESTFEELSDLSSNVDFQYSLFNMQQ